MTDSSKTESQMSMFSAEAFPVKTYQQPESKPELAKGLDRDCGQSAPVLLGRFDQNTPSLKTSQTCLTEAGEIGLSEYCGTFPRSGMMRNGTVYQLQNLARTTTEIGSGLWSTPTKHLQKEAACPAEYRRNSPTLTAEAVIGAPYIMWPTPAASDNRDRGNMGNPSIQRRLRIGKQLNLSMVVSAKSGKLNPNWVEWLMGFGINHTDIG